MLHAKLEGFVAKGRLTLTTPGGRTHVFGKPEPGAPDAAVRLTGAGAAARLLAWPDRYLGEAYMDGDLVLERGSIWDLLALIGANLELRGPGRYHGLMRLGRNALVALQQGNARRAALRNVAHHYDLSEDFYRLFLDRDMQYSCAYFAEPGMSIDAAQQAKKEHIAAKLALADGQRVLDIGCGWGGLALAIARIAEVEVLGVTLSREQLDVARRRAREAGLASRVTFELRDYRDVSGVFDRIVSVGMLEHVGLPNYRAYFDAVRRLLARDGVALVHAIGRMRGPGVTSSWIRKYIFPGGYIPALSEVLPRIEEAGLWLTDLETLRLHYAETLRRWRERFLANADRLGPSYDERFRRMWEFYLAVSEMAFRYLGFMVFQAQLARAVDAAPLTRDYMGEAERRIRCATGTDERPPGAPPAKTAM